MCIPKKYNLEPISIRKYKDKPYFKKKVRKTPGKEEMCYYYGTFDLSEFLEKPTN